MARALADIERDISALSQKERTELLRKLIDDLDAPGDSNWEAAWLKESERRLGEIESGTAISGGQRNKGCAKAVEVMRLEVHSKRATSFCKRFRSMTRRCQAWVCASSPRSIVARRHCSKPR